MFNPRQQEHLARARWQRGDDRVEVAQLFGPLHGVAFLVYVAVTLFAAVRLRWPWWASALALLAAIPPLVTLPLEWWFKRRGLLGLHAMR
ncbi:DUF3817 domain-containing protein [Stenotrophomonas maltophilia]|uniref:DUF3817 domain-containing protein n=1 Tax=Stenotrophomonas maltophilia TaxID=40324 RepID=UPI001FA818F5|nr:DUF3817 domain-containing protein [Stenotrophomonas maltophilia]